MTFSQRAHNRRLMNLKQVNIDFAEGSVTV
jgi:hypothetical protein